MLQDILTFAGYAGSFIVGLVISAVFYMRTKSALPVPTDRRDLEPRWARFAARALLLWMVSVGPQYALDVGSNHFFTSRGADESQATGGLLYAALFGLITLAVIYLRARLVLYIPSIVYSPIPEGLRGTWSRTGPVWGSLLLVFLGIAVAGFLLQVVGVLLVDWLQLSAPIARMLIWSGSADLINEANIPRFVAGSIVTPIVSLPATAVSIVVYRRLVLIDHLRAAVFD